MFHFLRSNHFFNKIFRNIIKALLKRTSSIPNKYRVSGRFTVHSQGLTFQLFSNCDDHLANNLFYGREWENNELKLFKVISSNARTIIDIGANTGIYSIFASINTPSSRIYSFEPHPGNLIRLNQNIQVNNVKNIIPVPLALGDTKATLNFTIPKDNSISDVSSFNNSFSKAHYDIPFKEIKVTQIKLDDYLQENGIVNIDLIKIDVEYYEYNVLMGSVETIKKYAPDVICEVLIYDYLVHQKPELKSSISEHHTSNIERFFKDLNYNCYYIGDEGILKIESLICNPDVRNFLFTKKDYGSAFISYPTLEKIYKNFSN